MSDEIATLALQLEAAVFNSGLERARRHAEELGISTGRLTTQTDHLSGLLKSAGAALLSLYAGNKMVGFFKGATQAASAFREDLAQFQHVMRNVRVEADAMVKSLTSDAYGRSEQQAMRMTMGLTSMLKGMEMNDKAALKLSGDFAKLSIDMGSFQAKDPDDVLRAFESALMGNTMALRSYGVFLNDTALKSAMLENAKKGLVFASEREARAHAILTASQKQQADAIGDFAVESQGYSNQIKKMSAGLEDLKKNFGNSLLEPARQGAVVINKLLDRLNGLDKSTFALASRTAVLGTAAVGLFSAYKIISGVLSANNALHRIAENTGTRSAAARTAETASSGRLTSSIAAETAALNANTVARQRNNTAGSRSAIRPRRGLSDARMNAAQYHFLDDIGGSFGMDGPTDFRRARRPRAMSARNAAAFAADANNGMPGMSSFRTVDVSRFRDRSLAYRAGAATRSMGNAALNFTGRYSGVGNMASIGRNGGAISTAAGALTTPFKSLTSLLFKTGAASNGFIANLTRGVPLLGRVAPLLGGLVGPLGLIAGIGTGIWAGLKALKHAPYALEWVIEKVGDLFSGVTMQKILNGELNCVLSFGAKAWSMTKSLLGDALYGLSEVVKRGVFSIINAATGSNFQTDSQKAFQLDKQITARQKLLNDEKEATARQEKEIMAVRMANAKSEKEWLDLQERINDQRINVAKSRQNTSSQKESVQREIEALLPDVRGFESKQGHYQELQKVANDKLGKARAAGAIDNEDPAYKAFVDLYSKNDNDVKKTGEAFEKNKKSFGNDADKIQQLINAKKSEDEAQGTLDAIKAIQNRYEKSTLKLIELDAKRTSLSFDHAENIPGLKEREEEYRRLMNQAKSNARGVLQDSGFSNRGILEQKRQEALEEQSRIQTQINEATTSGRLSGDELGELQKRLTEAKKTAQDRQALLDELGGYESEISKAQSGFDKTVQERNKRVRDAQGILYDFQYQNAGRSQKLQMATQAFQETHKGFKAATSYEEKQQAVDDLKKHWDQINEQAGDGKPTWNGVKSTSAGAIESNSVQAREMQSRVFNDINKAMLDNSKKQTAMQKTLVDVMTALLNETKNGPGSYSGTINN